MRKGREARRSEQREARRPEREVLEERRAIEDELRRLRTELAGLGTGSPERARELRGVIRRLERGLYLLEKRGDSGLSLGSG